MTYNPDTGRTRCDVCGSEQTSRRYHIYGRGFGQRVRHLCNMCTASGAYWCRVCEDVHADADDCRQLPLPLIV